MQNLNAVDVYEGVALSEWNYSPDTPKGKLTPYQSMIRNWVINRPRAKIKEIHLILKDRGYVGSYDLVKKKIHVIRKELGRQAGQDFNSPDHPQAQVDFGKFVIKRGDREIRGFLFTMILGNSGRYYAEAVGVCDMAAFMQCHENALTALGGAPHTVFYNPYESPLLRRLVGGFPFHLPIVDCGGHYGYSAEISPPYAPWMKGRLKRPSKILKKVFFPSCVSGPEGLPNFRDLNRDMMAWVEASLGKAGAPKENLRPLPPHGFNYRGRKPQLRLRA